MEASQASEAGSIPVARSTPARPRAGRFCYGRAGCARTTGIGAAISARGKAGAQRLHVVQTPHHFRWGGRRIAYKTGRNVSCREKVRPARPLHRHLREKTRPANTHQRRFREKTRPASPNAAKFGVFWRAGRAFSRCRAETAPQGELFRARHGNYSKSKRSRPLRRTHIVHVKPPAPMHAFGSKLLKPTTPLHASPS